MAHQLMSQESDDCACELIENTLADLKAQGVPKDLMGLALLNAIKQIRPQGCLGASLLN